MLQRGRHIARGCERPHETQRRGSRQRFRGNETAPPLDGSSCVSAYVGRRREGAECGRICSTKPLALAIDPVVQLWSVVDENAFEKGTAVRGDDVSRMAAGGGTLHLPEVDVDDGRIQPKVLLSNDKGLFADRAAQGVERLGERVTCALLIALRPEEPKEPVTANALPAPGGNDGKQRKPAPLQRGTGEWAVSALERKSA
jgi:hypothetical protein